MWCVDAWFYSITLEKNLIEKFFFKKSKKTPTYAPDLRTETTHYNIKGNENEKI